MQFRSGHNKSILVYAEALGTYCLSFVLYGIGGRECFFTAQQRMLSELQCTSGTLPKVWHARNGAEPPPKMESA
eukprot:227848-Amphidinium_carterae.1